jgi:hypothetical protein
MNLTDELRKLAELRQGGQLTDEEFAEAKRRTIAGNHEAWPAPPLVAAKPTDAAISVTEKTYRSSRWSSGNFFFPDRLTLADDGLLFRKGRMFGSTEEHISYRAIASFKTKNGIFLSTLRIETSGGSQPIVINGLWKSASREIQDAIRAFQSRG